MPLRFPFVLFHPFLGCSVSKWRCITIKTSVWTMRATFHYWFFSSLRPFSQFMRHSFFDLQNHVRVFQMFLNVFLDHSHLLFHHLLRLTITFFNNAFNSDLHKFSVLVLNAKSPFRHFSNHLKHCALMSKNCYLVSFFSIDNRKWMMFANPSSKAQNTTFSISK